MGPGKYPAENPLPEQRVGCVNFKDRSPVVKGTDVVIIALIVLWPSPTDSCLNTKGFPVNKNGKGCFIKNLEALGRRWYSMTKGQKRNSPLFRKVLQKIGMGCHFLLWTVTGDSTFSATWGPPEPGVGHVRSLT